MTTWLEALSAEAAARNTILPPADSSAMGTTLWRNPAESRAVTLKLRLVPLSDVATHGVTWTLWDESGGSPQPQLSESGPLEPSGLQVGRFLTSLEQWLTGAALDEVRDHAFPGFGAILPTQESEAQQWGARETLQVEVDRERWRLWVSGENLCHHKPMRPAGKPSSRDWLPVHLLEQLADWAVRCWDELFFGVDARPKVIQSADQAACKAYEIGRLVTSRTGDAASLTELERWNRHHAARTASNELPNLYLERQGDDVVFSWNSAPGPESFFPLKSGLHAVSTAYAIPLLRDVVEWRRNRAEPPLRSNYDRALNLSADRGRELVSSYVPGVPASLSDREARAFVTTGRSRNPVVGLLRTGRGLQARVNAADMAEITSRLRRADREAFSALRVLAAGLDTDSTLDPLAPWESGYRLAGAVRKRLGYAGEDFLPIDEEITRLGVEVHEVELGDPAVRGACVGSVYFAPAAFVNRTSPDARGPSGRRITLAHELCHLLFDRSSMKGLALLETGDRRHGDRLLEMRANAFAVELLVPMWVHLFELAGANEEHKTRQLQRLSQEHQVSLDALRPHLGNLQDQLGSR